jgi:hypothetical protein
LGFAGLRLGHGNRLGIMVLASFALPLAARH